jgi:hypothetical protein
MSVTTAGGDGGPELDGCRSAEEYVIEALNQSTAARSPKELAQGYGCGSGHIQNIVSELADEGKIKRVERGLYTSIDGADSEQELSSSERSEGGDTDSDEIEVGEGSGKAEGGEAADKPPIEEDERADVGAVEDLEAADSAGVDEGDEDGISAGTALVAGTLGLAAVVLLRGRSSSVSATPTETDEMDGPEELDAVDGISYSEWEVQ